MFAVFLQVQFEYGGIFFCGVSSLGSSWRFTLIGNGIYSISRGYVDAFLEDLEIGMSISHWEIDFRKSICNAASL